VNPKDRVVMIPKIGDYGKPLGYLVKECLGCKIVECPPITKLTVEVGAKHSPDTVCTPFKIIMGNFIEALQLGVNTLMMPGFGCRLGFYDMLHKQILTDLGYKFDMVALCDYMATPQRIFKTLNELNPELTQDKFAKVFQKTCEMVIAMDDKRKAGYWKPNPTLRIGLVGDLYTVMEPHANCDIERWLSDNNIEIVRPTDLTFLAQNIFDIPGLISQSGGYVDYGLGGNANCTIMQVYNMVGGQPQNGQDKNVQGLPIVDGIIHMKAATCAPEISAMTILQDISRDFNIPIMYLTFDTETGEAGLHTRLEAFCDMLTMKKEKSK